MTAKDRRQRTHLFETVVITRAQKVHQLVRLKLGVELYLEIAVIEGQMRILVEEGVEVSEKILSMTRELLDNSRYLPTSPAL